MPSPPLFRSPNRPYNASAQLRSFSDSRVPQVSAATAPNFSSSITAVPSTATFTTSLPPPSVSRVSPKIRSTKHKRQPQKKSGYTKVSDANDEDDDNERFLMGDIPTGGSGGREYFDGNHHDSDSDSGRPRMASITSSHSTDRLVNGRPRRTMSNYSAYSEDPLSRAENGDAPVSYAPSLMEGLDEPTHDELHSPYTDSLVTPTPEYANNVMPVTPLSSAQFLAIIDEVREAIAEGVHPTLISQGSSGSYFCRNRAGEIVGVFKPKNEEPYGHLNPKWTKWIHKNMFPCCFGRSCIIPNLGYISEAAASYIDRRLQLHVVPRTEVVYLAAPTFYYSRKDWKAYTRGGELPEKVGSFQVFLKGYKDATTFFREGYESMRRSGSMSQRPSTENMATAAGLQQQNSQTQMPKDASNPYQWSERARKEFQWGFERLAILDYLIRNTDRGLDNWMVKYDAALDEVERAKDAAAPSQPQSATDLGKALLIKPGDSLADPAFDSENVHLLDAHTAAQSDVTIDALTQGRRTSVPDQTLNVSPGSGGASGAASVPTVLADPVDKTSSALASNPTSNTPTPNTPKPTPTPTPAATQSAVIQVAAIDNGLAFPYKHPDRWRSYPYGWSFLPASRLPFSPETRVHILHLLTSPTWWRETMDGLEKLFRIDADFSERMWRKQRAVVRGEGYNLVECLRRSETGSVGGSPYGLVRRPVVSVFEDEVEDEDSNINNDEMDGLVAGPAMGMRPGRRRSFVERQVGGGKRFVKKVKQRFETFARSRPCFENW
ncbi:phosphatidyl inositol kinase [Geranomyces michiganensis]|nr:phosphatidyl inositol kinase [Geranomyces michiganensis]